VSARPLTNPTPSPTSNATATASPAAQSACTARASTIIDSPITDPTERSMPAVTMTANSPSARMELLLIWRAMFVRFSRVRK